MQATPLHRSLTKLLFCLFGATVFTGCATYSEEDKQGFDQQIQSYLKKKNWQLENTSGSGLYIEVLEEGTGEEAVQFESEVSITYKGSMLNGKVFDQTVGGKPLKSKLSGLIMGFQEGLLGHKKGAKLRMIIPPSLGYGDEQTGEIPPNSILVYTVELVDVY